MDIKEIKEYAKVFEELGLTHMSVKDGEFKMVMKKEAPYFAGGIVGAPAADVNVKSVADKAVAPSQVTGDNEGAVKSENAADDANTISVKSPLLGVFYSGSGDKPFVNVGDYVNKGDVLCTIEAMKMLNDIVAESEGYVKEVCAKDGELVEYNQVLFKISK